MVIEMYNIFCCVHVTGHSKANTSHVTHRRCHVMSYIALCTMPSKQLCGFIHCNNSVKPHSISINFGTYIHRGDFTIIYVIHILCK